jgi:glucose-1-phosphate cytidylyltransferase
MQVVILCGGKGTRLGDVTGDLVPKPMAMIGEQPILWHIMRHYAAFGHRDFLLCAGLRSWVIKDYFLNFHARHADFTLRTGSASAITFHDHEKVDDWQVTVAETGAETQTAGRIRRVARYLQGERFMLTYGDGVSDVDLAELERFHLAHGKLATMTGIIPPGRFGELALSGDQIVDMQEKPTVSDRYINGGFMIFERAFLDRFVGADPDQVMLERQPLADAAKAGELMLYRHGGFWQCMDTARDWALLNELWRSDKAPWSA